MTITLKQPVEPFFFLPETQHDVFLNPAFTHGDTGTHFMSQIVFSMRLGINLSDADIRRALASVDHWCWLRSDFTELQLLTPAGA